MTMKNHEIIDGKLMQTNKKFSQLKQKQKLLIDNWLKDEFMKAAEKHHGKLSKRHKVEIVDKVYEKIEAHDIWIPYYEVQQHFSGRISRFTNKYIKDLESRVVGTDSIDPIEEIMKSKDILSIKNNIRKFVEYVENNKAIKTKMCKRLVKTIMGFVTPYMLPPIFDDKNVVIVPEVHSHYFLFATAIPSTDDVNMIMMGLEKFINRCQEFVEPTKEHITRDEINLVLDVAQEKYGLLDLIAPARPLKIIMFNNSHFYYNSECGFTDQGKDSEAILLIYHPKDTKNFDPVFIFAHELGHALHLALTKDADTLPYKFDELNKMIGMPMPDVEIDVKKEHFADAVAIAILSSPKLEQHLPSQLSKDLQTLFDSYIIQMLKKYGGQKDEQ